MFHLAEVVSRSAHKTPRTSGKGVLKTDLMFPKVPDNVAEKTNIPNSLLLASVTQTAIWYKRVANVGRSMTLLSA
ncbi:MAG: hypothetical protein CMJ78_26105 [Planctomycetaceae bacterium]|nr:hypothetical protein [Planctomycetaceae bacterium]